MNSMNLSKLSGFKPHPPSTRTQHMKPYTVCAIQIISQWPTLSPAPGGQCYLVLECRLQVSDLCSLVFHGRAFHRMVHQQFFWSRHIASREQELCNSQMIVSESWQSVSSYNIITGVRNQQVSFVRDWMFFLPASCINSALWRDCRYI